MIIIRFIGGLGNQMFQYAFYKHIESLGFDVKADILDFESYNLHNRFELEKVFDIKLKKASQNEISILKDSSLDVFSRIRRKIFGQKKSHIYSLKFTFELLNNNDLYLDGYWQAKKFMYEDSYELQNIFVFKQNISNLNKNIIEDMRTHTSVSIHVRRGDYLNLKDTYSECTKKYYLNAISFFEKKYDNLKFYVFSNDITWCKKNIYSDKSKFHFISHNFGENSFEDMRLMKECKHNIIANSSFSWWGAMLNSNSQKEIICPKEWFVDKLRENDVFIPSDWIKLSNN